MRVEISRNDRIRMERAHVAAWPALRTARIDGWLWRASGGGSQRANSVSTIDFAGNDPERAIAEAEQRYAAIGMPARFQTFDESNPAALCAVLRARGYRETESTVTMFKRPGHPPAMRDVEEEEDPWDAWRDVYLNEITPNRRTVNSAILCGVPRPRRFFAALLDGKAVSTALCAVSHGCAVVECVATASAARRQGAATRALAALERWATQQGVELLGLQVVATNDAAITLYRNMGFVAGARNRFWVAN